ncbi:hypothetical protein GCM10009740_25250 [Terrabacter terrae]|uniref:Uncharacterized protein n=1 Tax=Terrabacter terrae TaxID=318434 RepID=A0ABP5FYX5_9MICO
MEGPDENHSSRSRQPAIGERIEPYKDALAWLRTSVGGPPGWWHAAYAAVMAAADAEHANLRADRDRWRRLAFHYEMAATDAERDDVAGRRRARRPSGHQ